MEKISYAQVTQRKKAPKPSTTENSNSNDKAVSSSTVSAPSSPNGAETPATNEQTLDTPKQTSSSEEISKPQVSTSAPGSPSKESASSKLSTIKDE